MRVTTLPVALIAQVNTLKEQRLVFLGNGALSGGKMQLHKTKNKNQKKKEFSKKLGKERFSLNFSE